MATEDRLTRLKNIRDSMESELEDEMARRAAIVASGKPALATYSLDGRNVSWSEYLTSRLANIKELNDFINQLGADGGIPEKTIVVY